jgi:hypothetical protein
MPSLGGEVNPSFHVADFRHVKDPFKWSGTCHLSAKLPAISHPKFSLSLLGVCRVVVGVGAPGGASGNFQSRASTISQHGCSTYGGDSHRGPIKEEEEEEEERRKKKNKNKNHGYIYIYQPSGSNYRTSSLPTFVA